MNTKIFETKDIDADKEKKKIQKLRFCILTNFKSQFCKNNLMMFALDNN